MIAATLILVVLAGVVVSVALGKMRGALIVSRFLEGEATELRARLDQANQAVAALSRPEPEHGFVRIHQTEGKPTLEGVLVAREPQYVLKHAAMIEGEGRTVDLDGTVEVLREHVALVQRLGHLTPPE